MKLKLILFFTVFSLLSFNVATAKQPCQVEPCPGGPPKVEFSHKKNNLNNTKINKDIRVSKVPKAMFKKPHPKWKKFWADFRDGFGEGFGKPVFNDSRNNSTTGNRNLDLAVDKYIQRNKISFNRLEKIITNTRGVLKDSSGELSKKQLLSIFGDREFVDHIDKNRPAMKINWGRLIGRVVGHIARRLIDGFLDAQRP